MKPEKIDKLSERIDAGIKTAVAEALEEHRRAGRPIVIWKDGKVVTVPARKIRSLLRQTKQ